MELIHISNSRLVTDLKQLCRYNSHKYCYRKIKAKYVKACKLSTFKFLQPSRAFSCHYK